MDTIEIVLEKYRECKISKNGEIPEYREFLKYADINRRALSKLFGSAAYSKLQALAGDAPNRLKLQRTPIEIIMRQYGNLVIETGAVPPYAEWDMRDLKPTQSGLNKIHNIKWSDLPIQFMEWVENNNIAGFENAIKIIANSSQIPVNKPMSKEDNFSRLITDVRNWSPARRRNSEAEYKIELRKHLEKFAYTMNEEYGQSQYDLLVSKKYAIEVKKDPNLGEYDRLFGQLARHLQHQPKVIVLILEATRGDHYDNFTLLVDKYLNVGDSSVEVIKK